MDVHITNYIQETYVEYIIVFTIPIIIAFSNCRALFSFYGNWILYLRP